SWIVFIQGEHPDPAGNFTIPVTVTPTAPGTVLLCAYSDDGGGATMAVGPLILDIKPAPSSARGGGSAPSRAGRPALAPPGGRLPAQPAGLRRPAHQKLPGAAGGTRGEGLCARGRPQGERAVPPPPVRASALSARRAPRGNDLNSWMILCAHGFPRSWPAAGR